jgi:hypothetical protein
MLSIAALDRYRSPMALYNESPSGPRWTPVQGRIQRRESEERIMAQCEVCGNDYDKSFEVHFADGVHVFDCFECAIHALAPQCSVCDVRVIGHGVEKDGRYFCCVHCAKKAGVTQLKDRV